MTKGDGSVRGDHALRGEGISQCIIKNKKPSPLIGGEGGPLAVDEV